MVCVLVKPFHHSSTNGKIFSKRCTNWARVQECAWEVSIICRKQIWTERFGMRNISLVLQIQNFVPLSWKYLLLSFWNFEFSIRTSNNKLSTAVTKFTVFHRKTYWPQQNILMLAHIDQSIWPLESRAENKIFSHLNSVIHLVSL